MTMRFRESQGCGATDQEIEFLVGAVTGFVTLDVDA